MQSYQQRQHRFLPSLKSQSDHGSCRFHSLRRPFPALKCHASASTPRVTNRALIESFEKAWKRIICYPGSNNNATENSYLRGSLEKRAPCPIISGFPLQAFTSTLHIKPISVPGHHPNSSTAAPNINKSTTTEPPNHTLRHI